MPKALILETPVWLISGILLVSDPMRMLQPDGIYLLSTLYLLSSPSASFKAYTSLLLLIFPCSFFLFPVSRGFFPGVR